MYRDPEEITGYNDADLEMRELAERADDATDWCPRCAEIVTYDGEICTQCGREWGTE